MLRSSRQDVFFIERVNDKQHGWLPRLTLMLSPLLPCGEGAGCGGAREEPACRRSHPKRIAKRFGFQLANKILLHGKVAL